MGGGNNDTTIMTRGVQTKREKNKNGTKRKNPKPKTKLRK